MFFWNSSFFYDPVDVGNLIPGSFAFSKSSLNIWKFSVHVLLTGLENFEHYFASLWNDCHCVVVWVFFSIIFLWDGNENWPFRVLWPLLSFLKFAGMLSAALSQHHLQSIAVTKFLIAIPASKPTSTQSPTHIYNNPHNSPSNYLNFII